MIYKPLSWLSKKWPRGVVWDELFNYMNFWRVNGYRPRVLFPRTFNEHLLRLKFHGLGSPLRRYITDKYLAKRFIMDRLGEGFVPETLQLIDVSTDLNTHVFPGTCVIKATHLSGRFYIKKPYDPAPTVGELRRWLEYDYYREKHERNYRGVQPRIIVERFIDFGVPAPDDIKIFCFDGNAKLIEHHQYEDAGHTVGIYLSDWTQLPIRDKKYPNGFSKAPKNLNRLVSIAEKLARPFASIRVDLYTDGDNVLVGELTNCDDSAERSFAPAAADAILGKLFTSATVDAADVEYLKRC